MSEVTICNLALSHLGDTATVASISPPDGSVQANLCARFYPVARNSMLEMSPWGFATRRAALALVTNPTLTIAQAVDPNAERGTWKYAYALPNAVVNILGVLPADAPDDYEGWIGPADRTSGPPYPQGYLPVPGAPSYTPQPYSIEIQADGTQILLTNVCDAALRYTTIITDTSKFSPLFTLALSYLLASMLAGPILKGDAGIAAAEQQLGLFKAFKGQAEASDANQRKTNVQPAVSWIRGR